MKSVKNQKNSAPVRRSATTTHVGARPSAELNLTKEEIAMLPDPDWVTEDDADAIVSARRAAEGKYSPIDDVLRRLGHKRKVGA